MKKLIVILLFLVVITPIFAQNNSEGRSGTYYFNVPVERIFPTSQGYIIQYRGQAAFHTIGIPNDWFFGAASRADIVILPRGQGWPSMSVFYVDGDFSHVRLYVHHSRGHISWGSISQGTDVSRFFQDGDSLTLNFR